MAPLLLALCALGLAAEPAYEKLPEASAREIERLEADMSRTLEGRRLLAQALDAPRRAAVLAGTAAVLWRADPPTLVFDPARLPKTGEWEFELAYARELSRAGMGIRVELAERETAARLAEVDFALDKADADADFAKELARLVKAMRERLKSLSEANVWAQERVPSSDQLYPPPTPAPELERAAFYVALLAREPAQFEWVVERDTPWTPAMVRLTELEDFVDRQRAALARAEFIPGTPYARVGGRRYPARLVAAARALAEGGLLAPVREALGDFEGELTQRLRRRIAKRFGAAS